jgi:hypothetical protein
VDTSTINGIGESSVVIFSNEKELRDHFSIQHKVDNVGGVLIKIKKINDIAMENILYAIENSQSVNNLRFEETTMTRNACTHLSNFLRTTTRLEMFGLI